MAIDRRAADQEFRLHMQDHIDNLAKDVRDLKARTDAMEHLQEVRHDENTEQLRKINAALFDEEGHSRLAIVLDILTTLRLNGKAIAFVALVLGAFGTAILAGWHKMFDR